VQADKRNNDPILLNQHAYYSNDGSGSSRGWELLIKKRAPEGGKPGWYGWISYTWSTTKYNDHQHILTDAEKNQVLTADERRLLNRYYDNTKDHYAPFDRTHIANIVLGWKINREWQIGGRWKFLSGTPYTPIINDDGGLYKNAGRTVYDPVYSKDLFSKRYPEYHRLDLRLDRFFNYSWGQGNFFVEALNVYLRDNQTGLSWSSARPYSATNPSPSMDFGLLRLPAGDGKGYKMPLLNIGIEMNF
jgi:hypothetical protein